MFSLSNEWLNLRRYFTDSKNVLLIQLDLFAWHEQLAKNYYWDSIGNIALLAYKNEVGEIEQCIINAKFKISTLKNLVQINDGIKQANDLIKKLIVPPISKISVTQIPDK